MSKTFSKSCRFECFYFLSGMSVFNFRMWIPHGYHRNTSKKGQGPEIYVRKECIEIFVLFNFFSDLNITLATIVRYTFSQMKNRPFNVKFYVTQEYIAVEFIQRYRGNIISYWKYDNHVGARMINILQVRFIQVILYQT